MQAKAIDTEKVPRDVALALTKSQSALYGVIYLMLGDHSAAEDVLQETNLVIFKNAERLDSIDHFLPWAKTIAVFQVKRYRTDRRRENQKLVFDDETVDRLAEVLAAEDKSQEKVRQDVAFDALEACVKKLPPPKRALIYRHYWRNDPVERLAREQATSRSAVRDQLLRIRRELDSCIRKLFCSFGEEPPPSSDDGVRAELFETLFSQEGGHRLEVNDRLRRDGDFRREWLALGSVHAALAYNIDKLRIDGAFADVEEVPARRWPRVVELAAALTLLLGGILWAAVKPVPAAVAVRPAVPAVVTDAPEAPVVPATSSVPAVAASAATARVDKIESSLAATNAVSPKEGETMKVKSTVAAAAVAVAASVPTVTTGSAVSGAERAVEAGALVTGLAPSGWLETRTHANGLPDEDWLETRRHVAADSEGRQTWFLSTIAPAGTIYRIF